LLLPLLLCELPAHPSYQLPRPMEGWAGWKFAPVRPLIAQPVICSPVPRGGQRFRTAACFIRPHALQAPLHARGVLGCCPSDRRRGRGQTQALVSRVSESSGQWGAWQDWILPGCASDITELQPRRCSRLPRSAVAYIAVGTQLPTIRCSPRSSIVIYMMTWGWSRSGEEGWEAAPWSVDFDVDLLKRMDMACA
jgi:hypothetical protein